jgi:hypothetical protein
MLVPGAHPRWPWQRRTASSYWRASPRVVVSLSGGGRAPSRSVGDPVSDMQSESGYVGIQAYARASCSTCCGPARSRPRAGDRRVRREPGNGLDGLDAAAHAAGGAGVAAGLAARPLAAAARLCRGGVPRSRARRPWRPVGPQRELHRRPRRLPAKARDEAAARRVWAAGAALAVGRAATRDRPG